MHTKEQILQQYWHHEQFRPLQAEIIDCALRGEDCIALLPTGGGKSVCYQLPALMMEGLCLVVSPLISLMQDQVQQLLEKGITASYLHAGIPYEQGEDLLFEAKNGRYRLLYVSPERLQNKQFADWSAYLNIRLIAVDEAHCLSQWGHDFRPEYLQINEFRKNLPYKAPIMALTASATTEVVKDIALQLGIQEAPVFRHSFYRDNIFYRVQYSENKYQDLIQFLAAKPNCSIVYCRSRKKTEELCAILQQNGLKAAAYHAGMPKEKRSQAQEDWRNNVVQVMVATTAFGMGINKADVRSVFHLDPPDQLENYYQETGRAGRDGQAAQSLCLYHQNDLNKLAQSTSLYFPPTDYLRKVYQSVCDYLQIPIGCAPDRYYDFDLAQFLRNFKLEATPASHALRLLAQEGLWSISEAIFRPASVQFLTSRYEIDDVVQRYPQLGWVATALLRLYSGIFYQACTIHLFRLAQYLRMKKEDVAMALKQMHQMNILNYSEAKDTPQLHFHHYRVASQNLQLDLKRISQLRDRHQKRTEAMILFIQDNNRCRNQNLLSYFGETKKDPCGHCDVCETKFQRKNSHITNNKIVAILQENGPLSVQQIAQALQLSNQVTSELLRNLVDQDQLMINTKGELIAKQKGLTK